MTNLQIIEKLKTYCENMADGFTLQLKNKTIPTPTLWNPWLVTHLTEVSLSSDLGKLLRLKIFHDDEDRRNCQLAEGVLKIVETFKKDF